MTHKTLISALSAIEKKLDTIPGNVCKDVKAQSESVTPVRTGFLKSSYKINGESKIGKNMEVQNDAPYAAYVEFGTSKMAPKAMMSTGASRISRKAEKYIDE